MFDISPSYLPYEACVACGSNGWWLPKLPSEIVERTYDLAIQLTAAQIADLSGLSVQVSPSGPGEMVPIDVSLSGTVATVTEYAGQPQRVYTVLFTAQLATGPDPQWAVQQAICGVLPTDQPQVVPMSGFCPPVFCQPCLAPLPPVRQLPVVTVAATGTTQATAAPVPLARVLINANTTAGSGGVVLETAAADFNGAEMLVTNQSGAVAIVYPYGSDIISGLAPGGGFTLQNFQTTRLFVGNSGLLIAT